MPKKNNDNGDKGPAIGKRLKISKAQRAVLTIVLITSVVVGVCIVLMIHFVKYISFNSKVITAKDKAISNYETTIKNVGICNKPKGSSYTLDELKKCNPNSLSSASLSGTLRYNVMEVMAENPDLESVARESNGDCLTKDGKKIDWKTRYNLEQNEDKKAFYLDMVKMCSSLRVIPDALPAQKNVEALLASLNQIFIISGWEPEALSPNDTDEESPVEGVEVIPVSLSVESSIPKTMTVLTNIEKSIRTFDITSASIEWSGIDQLSLQAQAVAYYIESEGLQETTETVYATKNARKAAASGDKTGDSSK